ncbi:MAG: hypothetical protein JW885_04810 [Deltaproteobacteria bacterium]|nr:hypothetical protein [Candidatus Zymogenaceae bacterium]
MKNRRPRKAQTNERSSIPGGRIVFSLCMYAVLSLFAAGVPSIASALDEPIAASPEPILLTVLPAPKEYALKHLALMNPGDLSDLGVMDGAVIELCIESDIPNETCVRVRALPTAGVNRGTILLDSFEADTLGVEAKKKYTFFITATDSSRLDYDYFPLYPGFSWFLQGFDTPGDTYTVIAREGNRVTVRLESVPYTPEKTKNLDPVVSEVFYYVDETGVWRDELGERLYLLKFPLAEGASWETFDLIMGYPATAEIVDMNYSITQRGKTFDECVVVVLTGTFDLDAPDTLHTLEMAFAPDVGLLYHEPGERWAFSNDLTLQRRWKE